MRVLLMSGNRDYDESAPLPQNAEALIQDLELETLFEAMAVEDPVVYEVVKKAMLTAAPELETILYRQAVYQDCVENPGIVQELYDLAREAIESEKKTYFGIFTKYPASILHGAIDALHHLVAMLRRLRRIADEHADRFSSAGFICLFERLREELTDDYLATVEGHLQHLKLPHGVLISARLGKGNKGVAYTLHRSPRPRNWWRRIRERHRPYHAFKLADRDESGSRAVSQLKAQGINRVADTLARSVDHIRDFFVLLRNELAFYIGCLNLHQQLTRQGYPTCYPVPSALSARKHAFAELFDVCLALTMTQKVVANDLDLDGNDLVMITGANQGGKSTFLRSIGVAQLMMQCGMFVPAASFSANVCSRLFTHFRREEDTTMESGKLDEELSRMSAIVAGITPDSLILFNESFAATNEREGSEIARQIVTALVEARIKIFFVTHLYDLAGGFTEQRRERTTFLRAERRPDGSRSFRLVKALPMPTSYGEDLYRLVFDRAGTGVGTGPLPEQTGTATAGYARAASSSDADR